MTRTAPKSRLQSRPQRSVDRRKRKAAPRVQAVSTRQALRARRKFLRAFPGGFKDETYIDWERGYKWNAHRAWQTALSAETFSSLIRAGRYSDIVKAAVRIESKTNLLFSFEKMALRDAVASPAAAERFAHSLHDFLHGGGSLEQRMSSWIESLDLLPRKQTRVVTWPLVTVFGFIAEPRTHFFFKPTVTREAARRYGVDLPYASRPSWPIYRSLLDFVGSVRRDISDLRPRDMIDMQSFLWVQGSDEYPD